MRHKGLEFSSPFLFDWLDAIFFFKRILQIRPTPSIASLCSGEFKKGQGTNMTIKFFCCSWLKRTLPEAEADYGIYAARREIT